jgi:hypothetical protein
MLYSVYLSNTGEQMKVKIVTTKVSKHCFYSGYHQEEKVFEPGMQGVLVGNRTPIYRNGESELVDFWDGKQVWRVALRKKDIKVLREIEADKVEDDYYFDFQGVIWKSKLYSGATQSEFFVAQCTVEYPKRTN